MSMKSNKMQANWSINVDQDKVLGAFGPCVKCGCESILMQYSDGKTHRVGEIFHVPAMECEHQDCRCGQCGYTWEQVCVDSTEKKGE